MLATGGLLGLLLMGAAVGGLVTAAGMEGGQDEPDPADHPDDIAEDEDPYGDAWDRDHAPLVAGADWLAEASDDAVHGDAAHDDAVHGAEAEPQASRLAQSSLGRLLFGIPAPWGGDAMTPEPPHPGNDRSAALAPPEMWEASGLAGAATGQMTHLDVHDTIAIGPDPAIPLVTGFDPATDRLILDFPGTAADAPEITVDLTTSPGDALILADGIPVTFVAGAAPSAGHIDIVMSDAEATAPRAPGMGAFPALGVIDHFDPATQQIEIDYDPVVVSDPDLDIRASRDGQGADILLNGEVVVNVAGVRSLDPGLVVLRPV